MPTQIRLRLRRQMIHRWRPVDNALTAHTARRKAMHVAATCGLLLFHRVNYNHIASCFNRSSNLIAGLHTGTTYAPLSGQR